MIIDYLLSRPLADGGLLSFVEIGPFQFIPPKADFRFAPIFTICNLLFPSKFRILFYLGPKAQGHRLMLSLYLV